MDRISCTILLLVAALAMHLVEEVRTGFRKKLPLGEMPKSLFVGINVFIYAFCFTTFFLSVRRDGLAIPFSWTFAIAMLMNGIGHIGIMALNRKYFPGGLTAPVLILVSTYLIKQLVEGH